MATSSSTLDQQQSPAGITPLLISLPSLANDSMETLLAKLAQAFAGMKVTIATPDPLPQSSISETIELVSYTPTAPSPGSWTLTAADFLNLHELLRNNPASSALLLGPEAQSLEVEALRALAVDVLAGQCDLAVPRYALPPRAGLVNSAILYPLSRALFGAAPRFPLAIDLGLSARMSERLAAVAQRFTAINQLDALLWPVAEASVAGFTIGQVDAGPRALPQPTAPDLNAVLAQVAGSLFADVDAKAAYWQRSRTAVGTRAMNQATAGSTPSPDEIEPMLEAFRLAYGNLSEIWSLVLPPHSLLGLKRLSILPMSSFVMPDSLWARIVYDFLLAYRLRTINRGHLLGALTPLYLAWVASHLLQTGEGKDPDRHIEAVAAAFESDKPYLVSRWRWPDRFNP